MTKAGPRTPGPRSPPCPRLGPLHTDTHSGGHSGLSVKLTLQFSCRVKLGCRGQGLERTPRHTEASHPPRKQGQTTWRLTYYRRLTSNRWVGRGRRGRAVFVGGGSLPACRFRSSSSYLWTQRKHSCHPAGEKPRATRGWLQVRLGADAPQRSAGHLSVPIFWAHVPYGCLAHTGTHTSQQGHPTSVKCPGSPTSPRPILHPRVYTRASLCRKHLSLDSRCSQQSL